MAVRTKRLVAVVYAAGDSLVYTTPAGKTAVVKHIAVHNHLSSVAVVDVNTHIAGTLRTLVRFSLAALESRQLALFQVLHPTNAIWLGGGVSGQILSCHISGAELDGVAP